MSRTGRPHKEINRRVFEQLCGLHCTIEDISNWFECTPKTLESWCKREYGSTFYQVYREKRVLGNVSLRRAQWKLAEKSAAMAIFLGKNYLGQSDKQDVKVNGSLEVESGYDLSKLTEEELLTFRELLKKAGSNEQTTDVSGG